jgi:hypothetical protein
MRQHTPIFLLSDRVSRLDVLLMHAEGSCRHARNPLIGKVIDLHS